MNSSANRISAVPTNIITGFLGVGKTTAILNLLKNKPSNERWAILVNEFGEVGVDGSLFAGRHSEGKDVFIREVPGGCMCCAAGLPMQIALNQLLASANPDRLLIEPTGLGHPREVLEVLGAAHYREVLSIQQCITLVDARKLGDDRYTAHDTFNQQIDMADIVIGHKADLYDEDINAELIRYVEKRRDKTVPVFFKENGNIDLELLNGNSKVVDNLTFDHHTHGSHGSNKPTDVNAEIIPKDGYLKVSNKGEGFRSLGWRFAPDKIFSREALVAWLSGLAVERAKGVFITKDGVFGYNLTPDTMTEMELDDCIESRIEIIFPESRAVNEEEILNCLS